MNRYLQNRQGFTLLEFLVTLTILLILLTLSFVAYRKVTDAAMSVKHLSNHREIVRGLLSYAQEHRGNLPYLSDENPPFDMSPNFYSPYAKTLVQLDYVSNPFAFFNPRFWSRWGKSYKDSALRVLADPKRYSTVTPWAYTSYGANRYGAMPAWNDRRKPANFYRVGADGNLSKLILIRDTYWAGYDQAPNLYGGGVDWFSADNSLPEEKDCYAGMVYASFADGHVEGFQREKMIDMMKSGNAEPVFKDVYTTGP